MLFVSSLRANDVRQEESSDKVAMSEEPWSAMIFASHTAALLVVRPRSGVVGKDYQEMS